MHDPMTVAHEIYLWGKKDRKGRYNSPLITIWHVDPEKDGTDDSCGWFIRLRHADKTVYEKIVKEFEQEWDRTWQDKPDTYVYNCGWFSPEGDNILSVQGIVFNMYLYAAKIVFQSDNQRKDWDRTWRFIHKHRDEITYFAENNRDSMRDTITRKFARGCNIPYTAEKRMEWIRECAAIVYTDIFRKTRPWYKHPRWHIRHWKIVFHPWRNFKRRYWDKCSVCGKRGFKGSAYGDWDGTRIWHEACDNQGT